MTNKHWKFETDDSGVAWVCFDKADSSVNVLSAEVMIELETTLQPYAQKPATRLGDLFGQAKWVYHGR